MEHLYLLLLGAVCYIFHVVILKNIYRLLSRQFNYGTKFAMTRYIPVVNIFVLAWIILSVKNLDQTLSEDVQNNNVRNDSDDGMEPLGGFPPRRKK